MCKMKYEKCNITYIQYDKCNMIKTAWQMQFEKYKHTNAIGQI